MNHRSYLHSYTQSPELHGSDLTSPPWLRPEALHSLFFPSYPQCRAPFMDGLVFRSVWKISLKILTLYYHIFNPSGQLQCLLPFTISTLKKSRTFASTRNVLSTETYTSWGRHLSVIRNLHQSMVILYKISWAEFRKNLHPPSGS